jgi:hypothetical protein
VDVAGNVYSSGGFQGAVDFDPGSGSHNLTSLGGEDGYVLKLDPDGNFDWVVPMAGTDRVQPYDLALDDSVGIYAVGRFLGSAQFGTLSPTDSRDVTTGFLFKLNANGDSAWVNRLESDEDIGCRFVDFDGQNNVYTAAYVSGAIDFDPQHSHDAFIDGDVSYTISLSVAPGSDAGYLSIDAPDVSLANLDKQRWSVHV